MSGLVAYGSSDEEEDEQVAIPVAAVKVNAPLTSHHLFEQITDSIDQAPNAASVSSPLINGLKHSKLLNFVA